jgi:hypothetical protein
MTLGTVRATERVALLAALTPASQDPGTATSAWVPVAGFDSLLAVIQSGALGAAATLDAKIQQATSSAGAGAKDVAGKALTQWTKAGTDKSNKQALINVRTEDLDVANDFAYVRLSVTVATAASLTSACLLGIGNRRGKASSSNAASVDQTIV